jgi:RHS repeat-associated protein
MDEPSPEQKFADLAARPSNRNGVAAEKYAGHFISSLLYYSGARAAYIEGGWAEVFCYGRRLSIPFLGITLGASIAKWTHSADAVVKAAEFLGAQRQAAPGRAPAHLGHSIAHNHAAAGGILGLIVGIAVGAVITVATGGLGAPAMVGALAGATGGGFAGATVAGAGAELANVTGRIVSGSPNVRFEGKPVARVWDMAGCSKDLGPDQIVEGSKTIRINSMPLARVGHKTACGAVIQEGCTTIRADQDTVVCGESDEDAAAQTVDSLIEVFGALSASREGGALDEILRKFISEPIDAATGDYADYRTDFEYPGVLPLKLTRTYPGKNRVEGLLGSKWICNWSQRLLYKADRRGVVLEDADGQRLEFVVSGNHIDCAHLKAPYYRLTGTRQRARLFDTRTQQALIFAAALEDPDIGRLEAIEDRKNNRVDFIYAGSRLVAVRHSDGASFAVATNSEGNIKSVRREGDDLDVVRYSYNSRNELSSVESRFHGEFHYEYSDAGWLTHWRDSGATRVFLDYDSQGRVVAARTPSGLENDRFRYTPEERKTEYFDATGGCWTFWFNEDNLLIRERDPQGNVTQHTWDSLECKQTTTDAAGRVTSYEYDGFGLLAGVTDWAKRSTRYSYDAHGQLTLVKFPNGLQASWQYDPDGNIRAVTRTDGCRVSYAYDARGRLISERSSDGAMSRWEYAPDGRVTAWIDALGNRTQIEEDAWRRPERIINAAGFATHHDYQIGYDNPRGSLCRTVHPDGGEERFSYNGEGLLSGHIGAEGQAARYSYGAFELLQRIVDAAGHSTSFEYDGAARLTRITNAVGDHWDFNYDAAGRLIAETDWAKRKTEYLRDALGRLTMKRLPDGVQQYFLRDERDRITEVCTDTTRIEYSYDSQDRLARAATYRQESRGSGTPSKAETEIRLEYDRWGRISRELQNEIPIDYGYDESGRCVRFGSPSGETRLAFDPTGLLTELGSNGHYLNFRRNSLGLEVERRYDSGSHPESTAFRLEQSYDPCGRLALQRAGEYRTAVSSTEFLAQMSRHYDWDRSGRLRRVQDATLGASSYRYDQRDQILRVVREQDHFRGRLTGESYNYDALMQMVQNNGQSSQFEKGRLLRSGNSVFHYDSRGRVISKTVNRNGFRPQTWSYIWDDLDHMVGLTTPKGVSWRYTYDALGRRVLKECLTPEDGAMSAVISIWQDARVAEEWSCEGTSGIGDLITSADEGPRRETGRRAGLPAPHWFGNDGHGLLVTRWHYEPGAFTPLAKETIARESDPSDFYPVVADYMGTPKELFSTGGGCLWKAEHHLWGKAAWDAQTVDCNLRFQGQWDDLESGLHYNCNRYYDPDIGQYLSPDPIGLLGGARTYGYVHNPLGWVDPFGLMPTCAEGERYQLKLFPDEPYNRVKHYGNTPTTQQRASVPPGMEFDHDPMLVKHFYEGPGDGSLPGYNLTPAERVKYGASLDHGGPATPAAQRAQGAAAAAYSKAMKKLWGL